ncbi:MAG: insulinase family protein [Prosthecobacter sp.]|jgi:zinc protease|uniref:M16 family metallopeptidase n=1 Tax=Prosthecobacter sp. TaxID=1965333 RepID=UPI0019E3FC60|nr:pitrilysin family protein [Prosthecobacter sp.]MBE2284704.1 insulinase family protein [Prosthecobacter sp.]
MKKTLRSGAARSRLLSLPSPDARVTTLPNGLEVIIREDHAHPLVSVQVWIKAGSLQEQQHTGAGIAHCVEHMLFKGTAKRDAAQISQGIQALGGYVNAYTSFNRTVYWIDGLAEHADGYLDILADMIRHSKLDADELDREKDVIRREMAMGNDDPGDTIQHLIQGTVFRQHPLRHPIIGHREVFDQITRADVAGFVQRHYVPNNAFIVIAGAVDTQAVLESVNRLFGDWKRRAFDPALLPDEPRQQGTRFAAKNFTTDLTRVAFAWQVPGETHPDKPALDVLGFLLGSGRSSRLYQELREKKALAHWVWSGAWCAAECGLFTVEAECNPADTVALRAGMNEVIAKMCKSGPGHAELEKAVRATLSSQVRTLSTVKGQASSIGNGWLLSGSLDYQSQFLAAISSLTPEAVRDVARLYLLPESVNTVLVGPDVETARAAAGGGHAAQADIQHFKLKNGLTLIVGENSRLPLISVRANFLAGVPAETDFTAGVTQIAAHMLLKGTKKRNAAAIASELENRGGQLACSADAHRFFLGADVMVGDEDVALDLLSDLILNPSLPQTSLADVKKRQIASILEEKEDPLTVAMRKARREIFAGQPFHRTALGNEETVTKLKLSDCRDMIRASFATHNGVISVFGDVKAAEVKKQVESAFAKLPKGPRHSTHSRTYHASAKPGAWTEHLDKEQAVIVIGFRTVGLEEPDVHALNLIDEACSDMGSRLFNRIREELGLAYYVGAQNFAAMGAGAFYFYVGTDPKKAKLAEKELMAQINDLAANGLHADEIDRARVTWRSSWLRTQQGNPAMADVLAWNELNGLGWDHFQKLPGIMAGVTTKEIQRIAAKYFGEKKAFTVRVMPKS